jgi:hypothetical protein
MRVQGSSSDAVRSCGCCSVCALRLRLAAQVHVVELLHPQLGLLIAAAGR